MGAHRVLVVEDSEDVASFVRRGLSEEGFEVETASDGQTALRKLNAPWDLVILDLMLPDMPGEGVLNFLSQQYDTPRVLVLSARSEIRDKIQLFQSGCDDYLTKPFAFEELLGRVRALLRRAAVAKPDVLEYEGLNLDPATHHLSFGVRDVALTPKEFAICRLLMRQPGNFVSRRELLRSVWGLTHEQKTNFVEVHLVNFRKKLLQLDCADWLQTVRTTGITLCRPMNHGS